MASANKDHLRNPADNLEFAGDYHLPYVHLINHSGEGIDSDTHGENITALVIELNIYESIFSSSVTGNIVIADTQNLISKLPIQGTERLSFRLTTKLTGDTPTTVINCTEANGTAMHIYAVTDKQQVNDNTLTYTLQFASKEFVRNLRTRVSESFEGRMDQMVNKIFTDENYLDSQKTLHYQQTRNQDKIVVPNLNPFAAIGLMCQRALPDIYRSKGAGYLFYETTKGFHFRSWESLCVDKNGNPRDAKQQFRYVQANVVQDEEDRVIEGYKNVRSYKFTNNFHDVAANTALGTYGQRMITHNMYDKSYKIDDYHYHKRFNETRHADKGKMNYAVVDTPVDYDVVDGEQRQKGVSDYPEARVTLQPTTRFSHNEDTGHFGTDVTDDGNLEGPVALAVLLARVEILFGGRGQLGDEPVHELAGSRTRDGRDRQRGGAAEAPKVEHLLLALRGALALVHGQKQGLLGVVLADPTVNRLIRVGQTLLPVRDQDERRRLVHRERRLRLDHPGQNLHLFYPRLWQCDSPHPIEALF